jgi:hypothetical protein
VQVTTLPSIAREMAVKGNGLRASSSLFFDKKMQAAWPAS